MITGSGQREGVKGARERSPWGGNKLGADLCTDPDVSVLLRTHRMTSAFKDNTACAASVPAMINRSVSFVNIGKKTANLIK